MKKTLFVSLLAAVATLSSATFAADAPPPPPAPPSSSAPPIGGASTYAPRFRPVFIGPSESATLPFPVGGKVMVVARTPKEVKISSIEFFVDTKSIGTAGKMPYRIDFDCSSLPEGQHVFKAIGRDESNKDIWTATAQATISKSPDAQQNVPPARRDGGIKAPPPNPPMPVQNTPEEVQAPPPPMAPEKIRKEAARLSSSAVASNVALEKTYSSDKYGFTIKYPKNWSVLDNTSKMKPKVPGGVWVMLGAKPVEKSAITVNIRRQYLENGTNADTFAQYNDYVNSWERKSVMGNPAFTTTSGSPESKRVVHRMIIIINGSAWMLNCTDTTGKPAMESQSMFESMANTLTVTKTKPTASVSVVKSKPERAKK